ncbi:hypothetical protein HOU00_gp293 [Caulobacter phage CcrPW]|uniref:Uncharacterized protein n=1 Tax=Caulobacter phage CcrPW TaxID=2283271 RepID=A0A385EDB4_9CAUD|nr:hypothetical protein HOU00_gp293 [Caulobacter phage CcrPW]AXQ68832.1 hypothetical protein CcrPW_gp293 [Caulobacter phage CcrPW]
MGMDVSALAGWGIITSFGPDEVEDWYDVDKPDWLKWKSVGAYEGGHYFLGAVYEHDWRRNVTGVPIKTIPVPSIVAAEIARILKLLKRDDGEQIGDLATPENFGFHVYTHVS